MNNYAIVESGVVTNIIVWNGDASIWSAPSGAEPVLIGANVMVDIGYTYDGATFKAPSQP
jgi:hypothetical protein